MKRWVIADTHFGHDRMIEKGYRPEDYNSRIINNWRELVDEDDLVIHLGDVAIPDKNQSVWDMIASLPGRKVLTLGNHDGRSVTWYMARGFDFACESFSLGSILFSHHPRVDIPEAIRYNIHGHLHAGEHRPFDATPKHKLISLEELDYRPVQVEKVAR